nr:hypothetical protein [Tanacetum cinerariifolium]
MQMVGGNGGNQFRQYAGQNAENLTGYNDVIGNQNQIGNGNLVAARAEGNAVRQNRNQIRCYNCREVGHYARNCTDEAEIQLQAEEYDLMAAVADLDEIKEVNANYILMANLQQSSTSGRINLRRTSVTGFPAQSISSSNTIALDSPNLLVLNTRASQSRQHGKE